MKDNSFFPSLIIGLLVILLACVVGGSYAENAGEVFLIHNGTQFGMTPEEVIECESKAGFELEVNEMAQKYTPYYGLWGKGTVAGIANVSIYYTFSDNGLIQADYCFPSDDTFNTLEKALVEKYGETDYSYITRKSYGQLDIRAHGYVFGDSSKWAQRIVVVSDSLVVAIDHRLNEILLPKDEIVYTVLSIGEAEKLNADALNDL